MLETAENSKKTKVKMQRVVVNGMRESAPDRKSYTQEIFQRCPN
jgi:hypothetical protein